ncbi:hypothetical protein IK110_01255 [Candidatus Saccharibacteria bacterium]|nr:hypothetical protein [Candidatus Saccharibacteria bacterium]
MDDDQFQGGLSVQGGNPDPNAAPAADMSYDTSAGEGNADLPPLDFEESTPAPAPEPEHEIDPEMSRKMDEALGGFDMAPMTPSVETPVVDTEPIQQPTDFASPVEEAPAPMSLEEQTAPVQPVAPVEEAPVPPVAPVQPVEAPVAPVETAMPGYDATAAPAEQPFAAPTSGAGVTMADYSSTPQSAQPSMQPMTTAPAKKGPNMIVIIALIAVLVVGIAIAVVVLMNQPKKDDKKPATPTTSQEEEEEEPEVETKQIGSEVHGYLNVPEDWVDASEGTAVLYKSKDEKISIRMDSATIAQVTAAAFANSQLTKAQNSGASQPQMTSGATKKVGEFNSYEVNYYIEDTQTWNFKYIFEASDNRTHYLWVQCDEPGDETVAAILKTFTLTKAPEADVPNQQIPDDDAEEGNTGDDTQPVE